MHARKSRTSRAKQEIQATVHTPFCTTHYMSSLTFKPPTKSRTSCTIPKEEEELHHHNTATTATPPTSNHPLSHALPCFILAYKNHTPQPPYLLCTLPTPYPGTSVFSGGGPYPPVSLSSGVSLVTLKVKLVLKVVGDGVNGDEGAKGEEVGTSQLKLVASVHVVPELDSGDGRGL